MKTYISILRGINVSGHKMIKMEPLKKMFSDLKFSNIKSYLQSGNIIFQSKLSDTNKINEIIKLNIEKQFGFDVPVITLTQKELKTIINLNPFLKDRSKDSAFFHITFLSETPAKQKVEQLNQLDIKD